MDQAYVYRMNKDGNLIQESKLHNLMRVILRCPGPVVLHTSPIGNVALDDFKDAINELEALGLGHVLSIQLSNMPTKKLIFVKMFPYENVNMILESNSLVDIQLYEQCYYMPSSNKTVTGTLRKKLKEMGYLPS